MPTQPAPCHRGTGLEAKAFCDAGYRKYMGDRETRFERKGVELEKKEGKQRSKDNESAEP